MSVCTYYQYTSNTPPTNRRAPTNKEGDAARIHVRTHARKPTNAKHRACLPAAIGKARAKGWLLLVFIVFFSLNVFVVYVLGFVIECEQVVPPSPGGPPIRVRAGAGAGAGGAPAPAPAAAASQPQQQKKEQAMQTAAPKQIGPLSRVPRPASHEPRTRSWSVPRLSFFYRAAPRARPPAPVVST